MIRSSSRSATHPPIHGSLISVAEHYGRRHIVRGGLAVAITSTVAAPAIAGDARPSHVPAHDHRPPKRIDPGFQAVPVATLGKEDQVVAPEGYTVQVLMPEGSPLTHDAPAYIPGDYNTGADCEKQAGAHHDGMHFFPLSRGEAGSVHGVLCVNFENIDQSFIHPNGFSRGADGNRPIEDEVRKEVASHGAGIAELVRHRGEWKTVRSKLNRRITAQTPMEISGPARGSNLLRTKYSPKGTKARGALNNCANGYTPRGAYLTCEEDWAGYFFNTVTSGRPREHSRYGVPTSAANTYGWGTRPADRYARFNATPTSASYYDAEATKQDYRNEPNTFGWVVEIDPLDPKSTPKKRNSQRGVSASQPVDAANPRRNNIDGHIIRWCETNGDYAATQFSWEVFLFGGPTQETIAALGPVAPYNNDPLYAAQVFPGLAAAGVPCRGRDVQRSRRPVDRSAHRPRMDSDRWLFERRARLRQSTDACCESGHGR